MSFWYLAKQIFDELHTGLIDSLRPLEMCFNLHPSQALFFTLFSFVPNLVLDEEDTSWPHTLNLGFGLSYYVK